MQVAWQNIVCCEGSELPSLPSRLVTDEDLKSFCEVMKISEETNSGEVSNVGMKRKSGSVGGLDTQHYGRGKRAREVSLYIEHYCLVVTFHTIHI